MTTIETARPSARLIDVDSGAASATLSADEHRHGALRVADLPSAVRWAERIGCELQVAGLTGRAAWGSRLLENFNTKALVVEPLLS